MSAQVLSSTQQESVRKGGKILRACLEHMREFAAEGKTTLELDKEAETFIRDNGGEPGFKGYHGFPATLCTSVNADCVHGLPGLQVLKEGDVIAIDCGVLLDKLYTDACITVGIGTISSEAEHLLSVTKEALSVGLSQVQAGGYTGDISAAIQEYVESNNLTIVRPLTGHGLGSDLHQPPDIPNFGTKGKGHSLKEGMLIAIEPIVSISASGIRESGDGWTIATDDGSLSAHEEHTVLVTKEGCDIIA